MTISPDNIIGREPTLTVPVAQERAKKPLRVQEVARIVFLSLAITFAAIGALGIILSAVIPPVSLTLMAISSIGLGTLGFISAYDLIAPHLPWPLKSIAYHIESVVTEILSFISQICLAPIDLTKSDPKTAQDIDPNETPILMIHGFLGASNNWVYHQSRLKAAGYKNVFTINLGNPLNAIDTDYARKVDEKVREIMNLTGRNDIRLVGHSMGGLVARQWRYKHAPAAGVHVKDIITMGSPLDGTHVAKTTLGLSKCGKQMYPGSDLIKEQQESARNDTETNYYHIGSNVDLVILPNRSAHRGAAHGAKLDTLERTGHIGYLFSDTAADMLIDYLQTQDQIIAN